MDCLLVGGVLDEDSELVAADAGGGVAGTQRTADAFGDQAKQPVAGFVAERVVDYLEVVEVDEQDTGQRAAGAGTVGGLGELLLERGAVGQPRQRVVVGW
jgi:hypothetical protein